jgi:PAS domain S-box-containing protein
MGAVFFGAWLTPLLIQKQAPVFSGVGFNTAATLVLAGMALLLPDWRRWLGWLIVAVSGVVIMQYLFAWMPPDGFWRMVFNVDGHGLLWSGHMAPLSAFSLLCAGLAMATLDHARKLPGQILLQVAPGFILAAAVGGVLNRSLDGLLFVATLDGYAIMSVPTMAALCVFVAGYLAAVVETSWFRFFYIQHEERQALAIGLAGFAMALLLSSAASVALLGRQMQATMKAELSTSVETQSAIIPLVVSSALHGLHARVDGFSSRSDLTALLQHLAGSDGSAWLQAADGSTQLRTNMQPDNSQVRLPLKDANPAWLIWNGRWMLEMHFSAGKDQGAIIVQEPVPVLDGLLANNLTNTADTVEGMETLFCGRAEHDNMRCFSSVLMPRLLQAPMRKNDLRVPMWYALEGKRGIVVAPDYRGVLVVAAHSPIAELGLGLVRKIDAELMYRPMRTAVWQAIAIMAGIGMIAALLIYLRVRFSVRRAIETGRQLRGVLDALPVGVWVTDATGHLILNNPAGHRIWVGESGVGIEQCDNYRGWWHNTGKAIDKHEWALDRAIEQGETSIDEIIDIACCDGSRKTISNSALPLRDERGAITGAVVVNKDITEQVQADADIRRLEREFHSLAENLPDIVSRFDSELRRIYVNPEFEKSTGMSRESVLGKTHAELGVSGNESELWTNALRRVFFTGEPEVFEFVLTGKNSIIKYYHTRAVPECDTEGTVVSVLTIARDISTLKGAEAVLRDSEQRLHNITSNVPGMVFQCYRHADDDALQFTYISNGAEWLLGVDAGSIQQDGSLLVGLIVPDDESSFHDSMLQSQLDLSLWNWEGRLVTSDGQLRWINLRATPRRYGEDVCMWDGVAINITQSKNSEEKLIQTKNMLSELSAHREYVREEERKRIAREIHDELGQSLTALRMDVSLARLSFGEANPQLMLRLQSMTELVDRTIQTARHVTSSLRPGALDLGIVAALEWLVEEFIGYAGIPCELVLGDGDIALSELTSTAVFRIIQESLTNIARHAAATQVEIIVTRTNNYLCFEVSDNGKGFDPSAVASRKSFGLVGIRERVTMMEGSYGLDSKPGAGTRIRVCVPVA